MPVKEKAERARRARGEVGGNGIVVQIFLWLLVGRSVGGQR